MIEENILLAKYVDLITGTGLEKKSSRGRSVINTGSIYGIKKIRRLILDLAIRGKLVEQDRSAAIIKNTVEKNIEVIKIEPKSSAVFELPQSWIFGRLGSVASLITKGTTPTSLGCSYQNSGIRFVKVENIADGYINIESIDQYISEETNKALSRSSLNANDLLFSIAGTIGRACIVRDVDLPANTNQALAIIRGTDEVFFPPFLLLQLNSFVADQIKNKARGGAMSNVSLADLSEAILVIPPYAEQERISSKVDELMLLCDSLEKKILVAKENHKNLVIQYLNYFIDSKGEVEIFDRWREISLLFELLFDTSLSVEALKIAVYQLAIMGRLTHSDFHAEQLSTDSPELMSKDGAAFPLPQGWAWKKLDSLGQTITGKTPSTTNINFYVGDTPFIGPGQITTEYKILQAERYISTYAENFAGIASAGDILMVCIGGSIGKSAIASSKVAFNQQINSISLHECSSEYIHICMKSEFFQSKIRELASGSATPIINKSKWGSIAIPIPPLAEQNKISEKVSEIILLCDQLESTFSSSENIKHKLTDALLSNALA